MLYAFVRNVIFRIFVQKDLLRVTGILQINRNQIVKQGPSSPQVIHAQYANARNFLENVTKIVNKMTIPLYYVEKFEISIYFQKSLIFQHNIQICVCD